MAKDLVETVLESTLHETDDPKEISDLTLKTVCDFYGGDWSGVMDIDMDTCLWRPVCWFRSGGANDRTLERLSGLEDAEVMPRWLESMKSASPIVLTDTSEIRESCPVEYALYERLDARSIIASPFSPSPTGFLVIRNPSRYLNHPEALFIFAYVLHRALAQQNTMEREEIIEAMNPMEQSYDVYISFFRDLEIRTAGGTLTEQIINAPKTIQLVAYLLLKPERAHSPREIFEHLNPGEDFDGNTNAIRGSIYRFSNMYAKRTGQSARLIVREGSGYRRNPELKITTDMEQFDKHMKAAELTSNSLERIDELRKAVDLYKGPVFMCGRDASCGSDYGVGMGGNVPHTDFGKINAGARKRLVRPSIHIAVRCQQIQSRIILRRIPAAGISIDRFLCLHASAVLFIIPKGAAEKVHQQAKPPAERAFLREGFQKNLLIAHNSGFHAFRKPKAAFCGTGILTGILGAELTVHIPGAVFECVDKHDGLLGICFGYRNSRARE